MLVDDGCGGCLLSSSSLLLLDVLLLVAILVQARDDYRLIDIEKPLTPTRKNIMLRSEYELYERWVTDVGWNIRFHPFPPLPPQHKSNFFSATSSNFSSAPYLFVLTQFRGGKCDPRLKKRLLSPPGGDNFIIFSSHKALLLYTWQSSFLKLLLLKQTTPPCEGEDLGLKPIDSYSR